MDDPHNLKRFVDAQASVIEQVLRELRVGRKDSHWMWFVFPQLRGLGRSPMAVKYAIASREEAEAYLRHAVLGLRLRECTRLVNLVEGKSISEIFGYPDDLKFHSSMTLFAGVACDKKVFSDALGKYFAAKLDLLTVEQL